MRLTRLAPLSLIAVALLAAGCSNNKSSGSAGAVSGKDSCSTKSSACCKDGAAKASCTDGAKASN